MAKEKRMDESAFQQIMKEITANAELIGSRQSQKQAVLNDFDKERARYKSGKISRKSLAASLPRVRKELKRLDKAVRQSMKNLQSAANKTKGFASRQNPKSFKVAMGGVSLSVKKKKTHKKRR